MLEEIQLLVVVDAMKIHLLFLLLEEPLLQLSVVPILASIVSIKGQFMSCLNLHFLILILVYIDVPTDCALLSFHLADGVSTTR